MYASVLSWDSVWVVLMMSSLNCLGLKYTDNSKRVPKFKAEGKGMVPIWLIVCCSQGKVSSHYQSFVWSEGCWICMGIVTQATEGSTWESALRRLLRDLVFTPYRADGDFCMRLAVDTSDLVAMKNAGLSICGNYY